MTAGQHAKRFYGSNPDAVNTPWLESIFSESLLAGSDLAPDLLQLARQYSRDGIVVIETGLDATLLDLAAEGLREHIPALEEMGQARVRDFWAYGSTELGHAMLEIARCPNVLDTLRMLYRREPFPFQTLDFYRGSEQATHSDSIHFHSIPHRFMCGAWVALEDVHPDSGPLHYYPGSHRLPIYDLSDLGFVASDPENLSNGGEVLYQEYVRFLAAIVRDHKLERREFMPRKGQALIWAANLFHGGSPIRDHSLSRFSQVTHYFFEGCTYFKPMWSDPAIGRTQLLDLTDLRTMQPVQHVYNGTVIAPGGSTD